VWRLACDLTTDVYETSSRLPKDERFGLTAQLRRAVVSIGSNIAEGAGRDSRPDFARFLTIAMGSSNEVHHLLATAHDLGYITREKFDDLAERTDHIRRMLIRLRDRIVHEGDAHDVRHKT
jgi:four helix bundle protein